MTLKKLNEMNKISFMLSFIKKLMNQDSKLDKKLSKITKNLPQMSQIVHNDSKISILTSFQVIFESFLQVVEHGEASFN